MEDDGICLSTLLLEVDVDPAGVVAGFEGAIGTVPRSGSNLSQLSLASNASTVQFDATSREDTSVVAPPSMASSPCGDHLLLIEVFCTFNGWIEAIHAKRVTIQAKDIQIARRIRGERA